jgi:hypothetical protein
MAVQPTIQLGEFGYVGHEPLNQRTYHADDFVLAPVVGIIMEH